MRYCFLCLLFLFGEVVCAQPNPGPRITALGMTGVAMQDVWSMQSNQAGLAAIREPYAAVAYKSEFFNPDLSTRSAVIVYPDKRNVFGLSFQTYGFPAYYEQRLAFTLARNFGNTVYAALDFNFHEVKIQQYGKAETYSFEIGVQYIPEDKLLIGAHIANPNFSNYDYSLNATIPVKIEFGASYRFSDKVLFNSGLVKSLHSVTDVRMGLEYSIKGWLDFRGGLSAMPFRQHTGFGCRSGKFILDAALSTHTVLGYSSQIAISYEF